MTTAACVIAEIGTAPGLRPRDALLDRTFVRLDCGCCGEMTETWDATHPACPYAVLDLRTMARHPQARTVAYAVCMSEVEYRERYVMVN